MPCEYLSPGYKCQRFQRSARSRGITAAGYGKISPRNEEDEGCGFRASCLCAWRWAGLGDLFWRPACVTSRVDPSYCSRSLARRLCPGTSDVWDRSDAAVLWHPRLHRDDLLRSRELYRARLDALVCGERGDFRDRSRASLRENREQEAGPRPWPSSTVVGAHSPPSFLVATPHHGEGRLGRELASNIFPCQRRRQRVGRDRPVPANGRRFGARPLVGVSRRRDDVAPFEFMGPELPLPPQREPVTLAAGTLI